MDGKTVEGTCDLKIGQLHMRRYRASHMYGIWLPLQSVIAYTTQSFIESSEKDLQTQLQGHGFTPPGEVFSSWTHICFLHDGSVAKSLMLRKTINFSSFNLISFVAFNNRGNLASQSLTRAAEMFGLVESS